MSFQMNKMLKTRKRFSKLYRFILDGTITNINWLTTRKPILRPQIPSKRN